MVFINEAISDILESHSRTEIAETLGVSKAMISTWLQKDNDFCPRVGVAAKLYRAYDIVVYPYSEEALQWVLENTDA